tara:strand:- start:34362 stop:35927 length:1566 start_codon:yes stop_codon:yes gene_type:complete
MFVAMAITVSPGCERRPNLASVTIDEPRPTSEIAITTFCGDCHVFPPPSSFPRSRWQHEVEQGLQIYADSGRNDLVPPDKEATVAWFQSHAPEKYEFDPPSNQPDENHRFQRVENLSTTEESFPKISNIRPIDSDAFLACEVYSGKVKRVSLAGQSLKQTTLTEIADPVHVEPSDLDGDQVTDYVVADIGFMNPSNQRFGTLWWVRPSRHDDEAETAEMTDRQGWETVALQTGFSRVCDARPIDYDQDGDQDLIVAEFGFITEGSVQLLTNTGLENGIPQFESTVVDERNGAIHVPVVDLDEDGKMDFLTLVSQEHESIEAHLNLGNGTFERKVIYQAADPAYASSGIKAVDIDADGDLDVLYTNGDTFDDHTAKPFHRVQWLENEGTFPFTHHHITLMPGVYCAVAGDIDLDGDVDVAAVSLISRATDSDEPDENGSQGSDAETRQTNHFDGAIWLEQTEPGNFVRHRLLAGQCEWSTCDLIDVDRDNDLDLVLGRYLANEASTEAIVLFENRTNTASNE